MATTATDNNTQGALDRWSDLKFGMFIHFGVYSMLAGKWKDEQVPYLAPRSPLFQPRNRRSV